MGEWDQIRALRPNLHFLLSMSLSVMEPCRCTDGRNCEKNRASPLDKNDKDAVAVYEVVRALHRMKTGIQYLDKAL